MDVLMAAIVAAAAANIGDRPAWLAAILADRFARRWTVLAAALVALAAASGLAAAAGALLAPRLTPEAARLFLALALFFQGAGGILPVRAPDPLSGWRIGAFATSAAGLFVLAFGDGVQFVVLALAAGTTMPALAAVGATIGALAVTTPAILGGQALLARQPLLAARRVVAALILVAALWLALGALRLI